MLLTSIVTAGAALLAAILLYWRLLRARHQIDDLNQEVDRAKRVADSAMLELDRVKSELAWFRESVEAVQKSASEGSWYWYPDRDELVLSDAWNALLGFGETPRDSGKATLEALLHPEDKERFMNRLRDFVADGQTSFDLQYRLSHRNGTYRWFHSRGTRMSAPGGEGDILMAIQLDTTESKQVEAAMMDTLSRFRCIYDMAPIVIMQWDKQGRIVDWNRYAESLFGYYKTDAMGKVVTRLFPETHRELFLESIHKVISGESNSSQLSSVNVDRAGGTLYLKWSNVTLRSPKGTVTGGISLGIDITAQKKEQDELMQYRFDLEEKVEARTRELRAAQESLTQIIEGSPYSTFVIDADHRVTHWNKACHAMFDVPASELLGSANKIGMLVYGYDRKTLADMVLDNNLNQIQQHFGVVSAKSLLIDGAYSAETFLPQSHLWISFTATPLRDDDGRVIGAIETL